MVDQCSQMSAPWPSFATRSYAGPTSVRSTLLGGVMMAGYLGALGRGGFILEFRDSPGADSPAEYDAACGSMDATATAEDDHPPRKMLIVDHAHRAADAR